jgi:hypothetical protein
VSLGRFEEVSFDAVFVLGAVENIQCRLLCLVDPSLAHVVKRTKVLSVVKGTKILNSGLYSR